MSTPAETTEPGYLAVGHPDDIRLSRHMLIEASAGTGKTYTIEHLVVRFLEERHDLAIENLLVVTFTEKATSELRQRIRLKLRQRAEQLSDGARADRLRRALADFDTASVFTIHGFCQNVLSDYAFENGGLFQNELVDDQPLLERELREQMRAGWRRYGDDLPAMLELLDLPRSAQRFMRKVRQVAATYRPEGGDRLLPDVADTSFAELRRGLQACVRRLKAAVGDDFAQRFARLNFHAGARRSVLEKIIWPLEQWLAAADAEQPDLRGLSELIDAIEKVRSQGRRGIECLLPDKWKAGGENREVCPQLDAVADALRETAGLLPAARCFLEARTVLQLQDDVAAVKERHGWMSYGDMLTRVYHALRRDRAGRLLGSLRRRYRVAFVDEFQDTDPLQWWIFRRIFLDGEADGILCLIGDPKQAIYGFRGADVYAYLSARREMHALAQRGAANLYSLDTNWRSHADLVACYNRVFGLPLWFGGPQRPAGLSVGYRDSLAAPPGGDRPALCRDTSPRPCLTVVNLEKAARPAVAREEMAAFIAQEIGRLLRGGDICIREGQSPGRPLDPGDICILVRGSSDVPPLEEALRAEEVPYSYYRKPGLFGCEEAENLALLLHAVYDPTDAAAVKKALLTPFFDLAPDAVNAWDELPPQHPIRSLFTDWNALGAERRWARLFQSVMEDSGLICRRSQDSDWERVQTNYQQLFECLQTEALCRNLDLRGLCALFDGWRRRGGRGGEDSDIHQIETERRKVQVMTIHVSKGLEFPVVFLAGGFTRHPGGAPYTVYHAEGPSSAGVSRVIDLTGRSGEERQAEEDAQEEKRLFYVALTRARFKLYLPYVPCEKQYSYHGSLVRLLAPALREAFRGEGRTGKVLWLDPRDSASAASGFSLPASPPGDADAAQKRLCKPVFPEIRDYRSRRPRMDSFSSLHDAGPERRTQDRVRLGEETREYDENDSPPPVEEDTSLPGGSQTGSMLHAILEEIDFQAVDRVTGGGVRNADGLLAGPETGEVIRENMRLYGMAPRYAPEVCRLTAAALLTPLPGAGGDFRMADVRPENRRHEVEFLYPVSLGPQAHGSAAAPGLQYGDGGFMRGFVDLVFRHAGKYYILDWKSNFLENGYRRASLEDCMRQSGYHLQYWIYTVAVCRWLTDTTGGRFRPRQDLGGVFYLFLRGLVRGQGVFFVPAERLHDIAGLEKRIGERLSEAGRSLR